MLIITSDRGLAGAYSPRCIKEGEPLASCSATRARRSLPYLVGRKGVGFYKFRSASGAEWIGSPTQPTFEVAKEIGRRARSTAFLRPTDEGGVDEVHVVYTRFISMVTQEPAASDAAARGRRGDEEPPDGRGAAALRVRAARRTVLDALLPQYVTARIYICLLAVGGLGARGPAAGDEVGDRQRRGPHQDYTRLANQARQAEITQEISEIVGGANALADAGLSSRTHHQKNDCHCHGPRRDESAAVGRIARIIGPVVDIEFPVDGMPEQYNLLHDAGRALG